MAPAQNNDQRLLDRILEDQHRKLAPDKTRDDFFTFFAADKALQDWDLDNDEITDGIVDGAHDCGIDGIWTFVDERYITADAHQFLPPRATKIELVILQAKNTSGYQETVIEKLHFHLPTLLDMGREEEDLIDHTNAKLLDRTRRFLHVLEELASSFPQVRIKVIYASKAAETPHPNVKSKGDRLRRELTKITSDTVAELEYLNAADLRERTARGAKAVAQLVFTETPMSTSLGEGYVCLARLDEYYRFITSDNEALRLELFESNVRDYAGSTVVNNAIGETLKSVTGEDFWWFNNGVTVVADAAQIAGKKIVIKEPQIVNGLQTSHEIYSYVQGGGQHRDRSLLVKIVVAPESGTTRDRIIRATNSQTQLPAGALRATESIQKDIEESLHQAGNYYYERRASSYRNLGFPLERVVSMARLAREFTAFTLREPHVALRHSDALLLDDQHYAQIFSTRHDLDIYRLCLDVHTRLRAFLIRYSEDRPLLGETLENWLYPLASMSAHALTRLRQPSPRDLLNIDLDHLNETLMTRMTGTLEHNFKAALRQSKAGGVDRIARTPEFTTKLRQAVITQSRYRIER
ncbi:abortive phage resistance protein [Streptomyces sp. CB02959]|uniref:AIPR family protein n=1 Tax=Streptomyces sp. CB02959 TaxID=2020330 RepID=UPI000C27B3A9|nr:AIPR family protein [Streptomyces sp. CB02959]PJN30460.1 abortive phage resistance protein [Streptomyces sp. CB02959]